MVFFRAHNFFVWAMQAESEEQRYRSIENHLKARVDQSVVDQTFYQACHDLLTADEIPVASLAEEVRNTLMENFNEIDNTTWPKLMYTLRAHTENRLVDPRAFLSTPINNQLVQIARQVTAMIGNRLEHFRVIQFPFMCRGRWFLGYSPGTFIFRYSNSLPFTEGVNNTPGHMNFKFEGQVPRSSYEHKLRLESLWKPASELFISTIQLFVGRSHRARYPRQDFLRTRGMIGPDMFKPILEDWISCSQGSNFVFPGQDTKDSILRHVVTQELAWLLLQLKDVPGIYEGVHSQELENLLTAATACFYDANDPSFLYHSEYACPHTSQGRAEEPQCRQGPSSQKARSSEVRKLLPHPHAPPKYVLSPAPPPLRMARLRYLRHWTIHRAWQLFRRQQHLATEQERSRIFSGMYNACEELRKTVGPGNRDEGYLYRVAMEKKGVWGLDAIPIEYARYQTDHPAKNAWNHEWKRNND
ncbi:hypothetical protein RAB80_013225 [Fusarium oxysporum f. sp. vasinfectum]|nr:hypothetical protein RAB80_013225 [Fusarium oxysporum f. sp. vasinfectum]